AARPFPGHAAASGPTRCASGNTRPARKCGRRAWHPPRRKNTCMAASWPARATRAARRTETPPPEGGVRRPPGKDVGVSSSEVLSEPHAGKLPACLGGEEVPIRPPGVGARRDTRCAAEHHLVAHELAVVLAQRPDRRCVAGIGRVGAGGPLPYVA